MEHIGEQLHGKAQLLPALYLYALPQAGSQLKFTALVF